MPIAESMTVSKTLESGGYGFDNVPAITAECSEDFRRTTKIEIPFELLEKIIKEQLEKLLKEKEAVSEYRKISDDLAEQEIREFIIRKRVQGVKKINVLDIMKSLSLPAKQINKVMKKLEDMGVQEAD